MCSSEQCELSRNKVEISVRPLEQQFTPEQEKLFNRRYEENYDIPDPVYLEWHPESNLDTYSD